MAWKDFLRDVIRQNCTPGQEFPLSEMQAAAKRDPRYLEPYPGTSTPEDTMRRVMQELVDDGFVRRVGHGV